VHEQMVRQLGDREDVDKVEEQLEERRALLALALGADDRKLRDDRARGGRDAARISKRSGTARRGTAQDTALVASGRRERRGDSVGRRRL